MSLRPTKKVEWYGGPHDGETFLIEESAQYVRVPLPMEIVFVNDTEEGPPETTVESFVVPIMKRGDGRFVAVWSAE